ncbi:MAG TPA: hypothetical protein VGB67_13380 [Fibrella sp.]
MQEIRGLRRVLTDQPEKTVVMNYRLFEDYRDQVEQVRSETSL